MDLRSGDRESLTVFSAYDILEEGPLFPGHRGIRPTSTRMLGGGDLTRSNAKLRLRRDSTVFDHRALITGTGIGQNVGLISLRLALFSHVYLFRFDEYNILSDSNDLGDSRGPSSYRPLFRLRCLGSLVLRDYPDQQVETS